MAPRGHLLALGRGSLGDLFDDLRQTLVILHGHGAWGFELVLVGTIPLFNVASQNDRFPLGLILDSFGIGLSQHECLNPPFKRLMLG